LIIKKAGDLMAIVELKCPSCGAPSIIGKGKDSCVCQYCGTQIKENKQYIEIRSINSDYGDEETLLDRAYLLIENGDFNNGDKYLDKVLDINPQNAKAYIGKLQCNYRIRKTDYLSNFDTPLTSYDYYNKAIGFAQQDELRYYMQLNKKIIERLYREKECIEQELSKLEIDISSKKEHIAKDKSNYNTAVAHTVRSIFLNIFSIVLAAFMIVGVIMEHSLVMFAIGIISIMLIVIAMNGINKNRKLIKDYKEVKRELKSAESKFQNEQVNMGNLLKKLMIG
jgi:tetratricopeptide (TPR) repeat protein